VVLPPQRRAWSPPYNSKVLKEKADSWWHGLSPSSHQDRLESALLALKSLADAGLGAASVLVNHHHRRIIPLMERELHIYEMSEATNPVTLARSRMVHDRLPQEYAATRARCNINIKAVRHSNDDLWSFVMLPDAPPVSGLSPFSLIPPRRHRDSDTLVFPVEGGRERRAVRSAHAPSSSTRARRSGWSRSERRERRSGGSGDRSAGNGGTRNSGSASSRDSPLWRPRSTRRP
jgi:hypothetical protein